MKPTSRSAFLATIAATLVCAAGNASGQSIEERLRSQLRSTTDQLHQAQDSQAQAQARLGDIQRSRDKAQDDLKAAQAEIEKARASHDDGARRALEAERASHARDVAELDRLRHTNDELQKTVRARDTDLAQSRDQIQRSSTQVQTCTAKNADLYATGHEILDAYEHIDLGTVLKTREPFAASARVKYDEIAQAYGDRLYAAKFDPRASGATPAQAGAAQGASAPDPATSRANSPANSSASPSVQP